MYTREYYPVIRKDEIQSLVTTAEYHTVSSAHHTVTADTSQGAGEAPRLANMAAWGGSHTDRT